MAVTPSTDDARAAVAELNRSAASSTPVELPDIAKLKQSLDGRELPGSTITIEPYQSVLADYALEAGTDDSGDAHPLWGGLVLSLRGGMASPSTNSAPWPPSAPPRMCCCSATARWSSTGHCASGGRPSRSPQLSNLSVVKRPGTVVTWTS